MSHREYRLIDCGPPMNSFGAILCFRIRFSLKLPSVHSNIQNGFGNIPFISFQGLSQKDFLQFILRLPPQLPFHSSQLYGDHSEDEVFNLKFLFRNSGLGEG